MTKSLLLLSAVVATGVVALAPSATHESLQQKVSLQRLFSNECADCHGNSAQGTSRAKTLVSRALYTQENDKRFFEAIKTGIQRVDGHSFGEKLTDEQVWGLVVKVREFQGNALRRRDGSPRPVDGVYISQYHKFRVEDVVTFGLNIPWSIDWLLDGRMLVTNRRGAMHVYSGGEKVGDVQGLPPIMPSSQGGLMEVAVHPTNGWVYLTVSDPKKGGGGSMTRLYRGKIAFTDGVPGWTQQESLFEALQEHYDRTPEHFGGKIAFDGEGHVFFTVGDRHNDAQPVTTPYGKVLRLNLDGSVPLDNPLSRNPMWSRGHRNQQGLAIGKDGTVWSTEHGLRGGDELNLITKGANYGWPLVSHSINYNDSEYSVPWGTGLTPPTVRWTPSTGASGLDVVEGAAFRAWMGDLLAAGLVGQNLDRVRVVGGVVTEQEELLHGLGRIREIRVHKDGTVYLALNRPDKIVRLVPED